MPAPHLFDFIRDTELAVLFVSAHRLHQLNRVLARRLESEHKGLAVRAVTLASLLGSGPSVLRFLHQGLRACGAPSAFGVMPCYYLFRDGVLLAWHGACRVRRRQRARPKRPARRRLVGNQQRPDVRPPGALPGRGPDRRRAHRHIFAQAIADADAHRDTGRATDAPPADELLGVSDPRCRPDGHGP